ncbi:MAG: hypothetical protein FJ315_08445 [SAR202 cluster bacterium]|nr:hypothetical protein [SAR202 cluster bacterium]
MTRATNVEAQRLTVIPAKAGIQRRRLDRGVFLQRAPWMPACAGMTKMRCHSHATARPLAALRSQDDSRGAGIF